jgi:plasmid stability protein
MSHLNIKKLESKTYIQLRLRARLHGVSVEEEAKQILTQVIHKPAKLGNLALELFGETNGIELELPPKTPHQPPLLAQ